MGIGEKKIGCICHSIHTHSGKSKCLSVTPWGTSKKEEKKRGKEGGKIDSQTQKPPVCNKKLLTWLRKGGMGHGSNGLLS